MTDIHCINVNQDYSLFYFHCYFIFIVYVLIQKRSTKVFEILKLLMMNETFNFVSCLCVFVYVCLCGIAKHTLIVPYLVN